MAKPFSISGTQTGRGHDTGNREEPVRPRGTERDAQHPSQESQNIPWPEDGARKDALDARQSRTQKPFRVK